MNQGLDSYDSRAVNHICQSRRGWWGAGEQRSMFFSWRGLDDCQQVACARFAVKKSDVFIWHFYKGNSGGEIRGQPGLNEEALVQSYVQWTFSIAEMVAHQQKAEGRRHSLACTRNCTPKRQNKISSLGYAQQGQTGRSRRVDSETCIASSSNRRRAALTNIGPNA